MECRVFSTNEQNRQNRQYRHGAGSLTVLCGENRTSHPAFANFDLGFQMKLKIHEFRIAAVSRKLCTLDVAKSLPVSVGPT